MAPGANNRNTGTVPKQTKTRNNNVPQEIVVPTRRDLQQLNVSIFLVVYRTCRFESFLFERKWIPHVCLSEIVLLCALPLFLKRFYKNKLVICK